jgi:diguanylate cyclase (GGDEF)-like protein
MRLEKVSAIGDLTGLPQTEQELQAWIRELKLSPQLESILITAIDGVFSRHERLWRESKEEAIRALSAGYAEKMTRIKNELSARDATVSSIASYFEHLVADLTDRSHRDPKTKLTNFARFIEQLESFLALEQRGRWCAIGLADIAGFKWYNDALGHAVGDRIIERVAQLLREQVRSDDLVASERNSGSVQELHARFGGDEFCFLIPDLDDYRQAYAIGERFREGVARYDWASEDQRLSVQPVRVDVGVVCLLLGRVAERRAVAGRAASELISCADQLMYKAKSERASHIYIARVRIEGGMLADLGDEERSRPTPPE